MVDLDKDTGGKSHQVGEEEFVLPIDDHVEEVKENGETVRRRGIFLLPNLITTAALFSGFYAIVAGMHGDFENAAVAIFAAMVFDGLDGRVARMTNTSSAFGVEYDSLSDMVSFGLAPALVMFNWALVPLGKYGWAASFAFAACAALRLARFNTQVGIIDNRFFVGLSSPAAAAVVAGTVWVGSEIAVGFELSILCGFLTLCAGLLMVSNIKYQSFKGLDLKGRVPFVVLLVAVLIFVVVASNPSVMLLLLAATYAASGPVAWVWRLFKK
ncbi:MAG: CDP-diacylglycerol--serine O-phosphatidyltransferase [Cellvibrionaceae bacterium]